MHFDKAIKHVLKVEGGLFVSDSEHGGAANYGISLHTLRAYRKNQNLQIDDLKIMPVEEAIEIYRTEYWDKFSGNDINGELTAIALLDQAVNKGVSGMKRLLTACIVKYFPGNGDQPVFQVVNTLDDRIFFKNFVCEAQKDYAEIVKNDPSKFKYLRGWLIRTHHLLTFLV